jgi:hypothetical protein
MLSALVCCAAATMVFVSVVARYNPSLDGSRVKVLAAELSAQHRLAVSGRLVSSPGRLVLCLDFTPPDDLYVDEAACLSEVGGMLETAAVHFGGFADEIQVRALASPSVPLVGEIPASRERRQPLAELRRRFDRRQVLESGDRLWPAAAPFRDWRYMVVHHSGGLSGSAASFERWHRQGRGWDGGMGYHFVIGNGNGSRDGEVEFGGRWRQQLQGAHAGVGEYNDRGIGICLVGDFSTDAELAAAKQKRGHPGGGSAPTVRQMESLRFLTAYLCLKLNIAPEAVLVHRDVRHTLCPGAAFPLERFKRDLDRELARLGTQR